MKELSVKRVILFLMLIGSAVACLLLGLWVRQMTCDDVYVLSFTQKNKHFQISDISFAEDNDYCFTFTKYLYPEVSNGFRAEKATVIATNDNYLFFSGMKIRSGGFFNSFHENRKMAVAVLNEEAAYKMFGNYNCIGENVFLNHISFTVIGIVKERDYEDVAKIYVSEKTTENMGFVYGEVEQLWCRFANMAECSLVIRKMDYSMDEIDVVQMNLYKGLFIQRFFILLALAVLHPYAHILSNLLSLIREVAINKNRQCVIKAILYGVICMGVSFLIAKMMRFICIAPPYYMVMGKSLPGFLSEVLKFYTLSGIEIDNMTFLSKWNLWSIFFLEIGIICELLCSLVPVKNLKITLPVALKGDDTFWKLS